MKELRHLVEDALRRSMATADGRAVITSAAAPNLYVQWLVFGDDEGVRLEVSNPGNQRKSIWRRLRRGGGDTERAAALGEQQVAALLRLGFTEGSPNYERYIAAGELDQGQVADLLAAALREALGVRQPSDVTVEVL